MGQTNSIELVVVWGCMLGRMRQVGICPFVGTHHICESFLIWRRYMMGDNNLTRELLGRKFI